MHVSRLADNVELTVPLQQVWIEHSGDDELQRVVAAPPSGIHNPRHLSKAAAGVEVHQPGLKASGSTQATHSRPGSPIPLEEDI